MRVVRLHPGMLITASVIVVGCVLVGLTVFEQETYRNPKLRSLQNLQIDAFDGIHPYSKCTAEKRNVVFIKNHKCGSDTVTNVFHRFGFDRTLSFMLAAPGRYTLNWPYMIMPGTYREPKARGGFNILCEHAVYSERIMSKLMPSDTEYTTIVREPFSRLRSAFNFFHIDWRAEIHSDEPLQEYLSDIRRYEIHIRSPSHVRYKKHCMGPGWTAGQNGMSFDLGFDNGFHQDTVDQTGNATYIREWLQHLHNRFNLVMILEHFEESLVLLRRLMCWRMQDVLYLVRNVGNYHYKSSHVDNIDPSLMDNFRRFNQVDIALYDLFNATLWRRIELEGPDYADELRQFKVVMKTVRDFCYSDPPPSNATALSIPQSDWNDEFSVTGRYCTRMAKGQYNDIMHRYRDNKVRVKKSLPVDKLPGC